MVTEISNKENSMKKKKKRKKREITKYEQKFYRNSVFPDDLR